MTGTRRRATHWSELRSDAPRLAALGEQRLVAPGVVLVATVRADGTPRVSPVEPLLWEGDLWLSMMRNSLKAQDLARDSRLLVHSIVTARDGVEGEYKVRGRARGVEDRTAQERYAVQTREQLGWEPTPGQFHLFWLDIDDVSYLRYAASGDGDQFVTRWPAGREYVRRGVTPTSLGPPQPYRDLLDT